MRFLSWNHRTSTPHRSETNGTAERAVRRVKEGTSAVLIQSGLDERWWSDSMECCCFSAKCPRPPGRRGKHRMKDVLENHSKWPIIPFGGMVDYRPSSPKDQMRTHQFGKKVPPGIFLGSELIAGRIWKGDILKADLEDLEKLDASNICPRRINAKEVLISQKDDEFVFPIADEQQNSQGEATNSEYPLGVKITVEKFKANRESLNRQNQQMSLKPGAILGRSKLTSSVVIAMNLEFNSMCRKKKHSLFH